MFDDLHDFRAAQAPEPGVPESDAFARRCREPADRWVMERRAKRPQAERNHLPRVVTL